MYKYVFWITFILAIIQLTIAIEERNKNKKNW